MPLPSTPEELARAIAALDRELVQLDREIQQHAAGSPELAPLLERRDRVRRERISLQFFVEDSPAPGRKPRDPERLALPTGRPGCGRPLAVLMLIAAGIGALYFMLVSRPAPAPAPRAESSAVRVPATRKADASAQPVPQPPSAASAEQPPSDASVSDSDETPAAAEQVEVEWRAKIRSVQGLALAPQSVCTIKAALRLEGADHAVVARPTIVCGQQKLYSWDEPVGASASRRTWRFWERAAVGAGGWEYWLQYSDLGARSAPLNVKIDTPAGRILLWREGEPGVRVELDVERWAKRPGTPLFVQPLAEPKDFEIIERKGRITTATGVPAEPTGTACTFKLVPNEGSHNCRALLQCGNSTIYGGDKQGYLDCLFVDGLPNIAHDAQDTDGDPIFDMELAAGRLLTSTTDPVRGYRVTVTLEP